MTDATLSGAILIIIAGGYAAPYLISRISGFIVAAGTPAAIAARDFISFLLKKGQPLLYNENLQPYIQTLLHAAAASIVITRREDGSYIVYFDGETFVILASMGTLFLAVSEMHKYLAWAKKKATGAGSGAGSTNSKPAGDIRENPTPRTDNVVKAPGSAGSLKSVGSNSRANEIAQKLGFEAQGGMRPAEVLKSEYVGKANVSHFDIMKDTATNEIILLSKNGVQVPTGLFLP